MAGFEQQQNIPEVWKDKSEELSEKLNQSITDSRQSEQMKDYIEYFKRENLNGDYIPENYFLWSVLEPKALMPQSGYLDLDIADPFNYGGPGLIEKFIVETISQMPKIEEVSEEEKLAA